MQDLLILGAGASGLSLGLLTGAPIVEAGSRPGGHAVSTVADGYTFDRGPHIMFSRSALLLDCMVSSLGGNVHRCVRNNKVSVGGALLKYPIENDLVGLSVDLRASVLVGYVNAQLERARAPREPANLAEWFVDAFGEDLTELYFRPYNEKVWKIALEDLSMSWADRIPCPPVDDVIRSAVGEETEGYLHQLHYHYPRRGGYSALMDAWVSGIDPGALLLDRPVTRIRPGGGGTTVETAGGSFVASTVVSTIPIATMVAITDGVPPEVASAAGRLRTNATITVTFGFRGEDPNQWTAVYVPDPEFLPNRVSYPAVFSPENAPPGCFSVQAEITVPALDPVRDGSDGAVADHVLRGLRERGLVPADAELEHTYVERHDPAYVVYTTGYEKDLELVKGWFGDRGVVLHGRFGSHSYLNVDGCLEQSIDLARSLGGSWADDAVRALFAGLGDG